MVKQRKSPHESRKKKNIFPILISTCSPVWLYTSTKDDNEETTATL